MSYTRVVRSSESQENHLAKSVQVINTIADLKRDATGYRRNIRQRLFFYFPGALIPFEGILTMGEKSLSIGMVQVLLSREAPDEVITVLAVVLGAGDRG
ncbi:hypothetical protein F4825DRAFT_446448 [Nemania diffusa]|nr:hypothetical protein F4825DRAFT_446448 [Nemania diffusa]